MSDWQKLLIELCCQARLVAGNNDITRQEKLDLKNLADKVEAGVIKEVNRTLTSQQ